MRHDSPEGPRRGTHSVFACIALALFGSTAFAQETRISVGLGASVPLGRFIDSFPLVLREDPCGADFDSDPSLARTSLDNDAGLSLSASLLVGGFEIAYSFARHTWGALDVTGYAYCLGENNPLNNIFLDSQGLADLGLVETGTRVLDDADDVLSPLYTHRLLLGYRFYVLDGALRPYIPLALGPTLMHGDDFDTLFGGTVQIGIGLEYDFGNGIIAGVDGRYTADIMENIALKSQTTSDLATQATAGGESLFETVIEVFQSFVISATVGYGF